MSNDYEDFTAIVQRYLAVENVHTGWPGGVILAKVEPIEFGFTGYVRADLLPGGCPGPETPADQLRAALLDRSEELVRDLAENGFLPVYARLDQEFTSRFGSPQVRPNLDLVQEPPQYEVSLKVSCTPMRRYKR